MDNQELIRERVHEYYWQHDWNCAVTTLRVLAEIFDVPLEDQVLDAALGMHGAGGHRDQCGLVEGMLMFLGVLGKRRRMPDEVVVSACYDFAAQFERRFGALTCRELRPEGFHPNQPPHLCEELTVDAIQFDVQFVSELLEERS